MLFNPISTSVGVKLPPPHPPPTPTFWKISESINWFGLCFCDFQFISISHIPRNLQGSAALGSQVVTIFENFSEIYNFVQISDFLYSCRVAVF